MKIPNYSRSCFRNFETTGIMDLLSIRIPFIGIILSKQLSKQYLSNSPAIFLKYSYYVCHKSHDKDLIEISFLNYLVRIGLVFVFITGFQTLCHLAIIRCISIRVTYKSIRTEPYFLIYGGRFFSSPCPCLEISRLDHILITLSYSSRLKRCDNYKMGKTISRM